MNVVVQDGCGSIYKMGVVACTRWVWWHVQDGCGSIYKMGVVAYTHTRQVVHVRDTYCSEVHLLSMRRAGECVYAIRVTHHGMGDRVYCDTILNSLQTMHMKRRGSSVSLNHSTFVCRAGVGKDGL